jgi:hypothetical protein
MSSTITTTTTAIRPLTGTQQRAIRRSAEPEGSSADRVNPALPQGSSFSLPSVTIGSGEPEGLGPPRGEDSTSVPPSGGPGDPDDPDEPGDPDIPEDIGDPSSEDEDHELSNKDLAHAILALAKGKAPEEKRRSHVKTHEPDTFDGSSDQKLRVFLFQCKVYFRTRKREFADDEDKVFFAISYLRDAALDYFEPFINEPNPDKVYDFLTSWPAFMQKLTNLFGSYTPEDDDEDALATITFPNHGKATTYFIEFAKYQNRIEWNDRSLRRAVKEAIPSRITDELRFAREDIATFEGFREAVLRIDNEYWKRKKDDANKQRLVHALQSRLSKSSGTREKHHPASYREQSSAPNNSSASAITSASASASASSSAHKHKKKTFSRPPTTFTRAPNTSSAPSENISSILGPNGKLTQAERARRMKEGLCMLCGRKGHTVKDCPKAKNNSSPSGQTISKARAVKAEPVAGPSQPKN